MRRDSVGLAVVLGVALLAACAGLLFQASQIKILHAAAVGNDHHMDTARAPAQQGPELNVGNEESTTSNSESLALRSQRAQLLEQLRKVKEQLDNTEPCVPGQEHPELAYVGPGTWVNPDPRDGLRQVIISGTGEAMTIRAEVGLQAEEGQWPEARLERALTDANSYWRGIASWQSSAIMVTFERRGLRVDWIQRPKRQHGETQATWCLNNPFRISIQQWLVASRTDLL